MTQGQLCGRVSPRAWVCRSPGCFRADLTFALHPRSAEVPDRFARAAGLPRCEHLLLSRGYWSGSMSLPYSQVACGWPLRQNRGAEQEKRGKRKSRVDEFWTSIESLEGSHFSTRRIWCACERKHSFWGLRGVEVPGHVGKRGSSRASMGWLGLPSSCSPNPGPKAERQTL